MGMHFFRFIASLIVPKIKLQPEVEVKVDTNEQTKWDKYQESCNQRKEQHAKNLHPSATGCQVGLKWSLLEDVMLINSLARGITLFELSGILGRPVYGIQSRLSHYRLVYINPRYYYNEVSHRVPVYFNNMDKKIIKALVQKGWTYSDTGKFLEAPSWYIAMKRINKN